MRTAGRVLGYVGAAIGVLAAISFLIYGSTVSNGVAISTFNKGTAGAQGPVTITMGGQGVYGSDIQIGGWVILSVTAIITIGWLISLRRPKLAGSLLIFGGVVFFFLAFSLVVFPAALAWIVGGVMTIAAARRTAAEAAAQQTES